MAIGDSTAEIDFMLADIGVPVRYGSADVFGSFRRRGEVIEENGIAIALESDAVRVRHGAITGLLVENDISIDGAMYRITNIGLKDIEGLQRIDVVRVGAA